MHLKGRLISLWDISFLIETYRKEFTPSRRQILCFKGNGHPREKIRNVSFFIHVYIFLNESIFFLSWQIFSFRNIPQWEKISDNKVAKSDSKKLSPFEKLQPIFADVSTQHRKTLHLRKPFHYYLRSVWATFF